MSWRPSVVYETYKKKPIPKTFKRTEKAWLDKHFPSKVSCNLETRRMTFIENVRYMRIYTYDARSYLIRKIDPRPPFEQPKHYARWPRKPV